MTFVTRLWRTRRLAWYVLAASLAVHLPIAAVAINTDRAVVAYYSTTVVHADFDNYYDIGTKPGRPYVDYPLEFPVATAQTFKTLADLSGSRQRFGIAMIVVNAAADLAIVAALGWGWGVEAAAAYAFIVIPLLDLFLLRMDLWPTMLTAIAAAAWRRDRTIVTAVGLVAGAAFKLWPVMFFPLLLVPRSGRLRPTPLVAACGAGLLVLAWWVWVAGVPGLYQVLTFRGARGWELESTVGGVWMLFDRSSIRVENGAWRIGQTFGPISILLFALGAVPCLWMIWRGARTNRLGAGWVGGLSVLLVTSALLSPQYAVWTAPGGGVAWAEKDRRTSVLAWIAVFLTNLEYKAFGPLLRGAGKSLFLVNARNLFLAVLVFDIARRLARSPVSAAPGERAHASDLFRNAL